MINLSHLAAKWPSSIVCRREVGKFSGEVLSEKYMANLDSLGMGPKRFYIGRRTVYIVSDLIEWMESRASLRGKGFGGGRLVHRGQPEL